MAAPDQSVELIETKEIELFLPIMREIDFGDAFLLSMLHWCGIGKRSTPLEYWRVFLLRLKSEIIGVSGLYRQPGTPANICWLGWFAIRPQFRRQGFGTAAIRKICGMAHSAGSSELWVYTGSDDNIARTFYLSLASALKFSVPPPNTHPGLCAWDAHNLLPPLNCTVSASDQPRVSCYPGNQF
jgi:GNAT superfamily N-acetyltransferase